MLLDREQQLLQTGPPYLYLTVEPQKPIPFRRQPESAGSRMNRAVACLLIALFFLSIMLGGCSTLEDSVALAMLESTESVEAQEFPELIMTDYRGLDREVKILSVRGRVVTATPFPYWAEDPLDISINEIKSLKFKKKANPGTTLTVAMMEFGYILSGGVFGALATTSGGYGLAFLVGLGGAVVGLGGSFYYDIPQTGEEMYPEYILDGKSESEKLRTIFEIMGVFEPRRGIDLGKRR